MILFSLSVTCQAQKITHDKQKEKQWRSMETGPWDFAPDWYYYFLHKDYSGAYLKWEWHGFKSGYRVHFDEKRSHSKTIMPRRTAAEYEQQQKLKKAEEERQQIEPLYKEGSSVRLTVPSTLFTATTKTISTACRTTSPKG